MKRLLCCLLLVLMAAISTAPVYSQGEPPPASNVTIHVVQRGENLTAIAERYGLTVEELARFNGITNPSALVVGQRLLIPLNLPPEAVEPQVHVVQPGETLAGIAALYGLDVQALAAQNAITEINTVYVGQTLTISAGAEPIPQATAEVIASDVRHVIQAGETLFGIATQYGVSMADLQQLNGITNPETIFAGQELLIPGGYVPVTALDLPASLTSVEVRPLTLYTGQTARVRLVAASPVTMTATFLGAAVPVIFEQESYRIFLGVPVGTEAGIYPLELSITPDGGQSLVWSINIQVQTGQYGTQYITLPEDRANLLAPAVEENELNLLRAVTTGFNAERYFDGPMGLPAAAVMNSPFGVSRAYNGGPVDRYHNGADFAGAPGSPVLAAAPGRVVLADSLYIRGNTLMIDHGWGVYTVYAHLSERYVNLGDFVSTGQRIGAVGSTGRATGAHLHWEVWVNGVAVDPMQWVREAFP